MTNVCLESLAQLMHGHTLLAIEGPYVKTRHDVAVRIVCLFIYLLEKKRVPA